MLAAWLNKPFLAITVLLGIVLVGNIGYNYSILVEQDETGLVPLSLRDSPIVKFLAVHTLRRKILSGAVSGTDALWLTLLVTQSSAFDAEEAFERADEILSYGVDIDSRASSGDTLLIRSVMANLPEIVVYLLERCADPNSGESAFLELTNQEDAIEFAYFLEKKYPEKDYSRVIAALQDQKLAGRCDKSAGSAAIYRYLSGHALSIGAPLIAWAFRAISASISGSKCSANEWLVEVRPQHNSIT